MEILTLFHDDNTGNDVRAYNEFGMTHRRCTVIDLYDSNVDDEAAKRKAEANVKLCPKHNVGVVYINMKPDTSPTE